MFLLLRAREMGVPEYQVPLLWALVSLVAMLFSTPLSALSDRLGRVRLIISRLGGVWPVLSAAGAEWQRPVAAVAAVRLLRPVPGRDRRRGKGTGRRSGAAGNCSARPMAGSISPPVCCCCRLRCCSAGCGRASAPCWRSVSRPPARCWRHCCCSSGWRRGWWLPSSSIFANDQNGAGTPDMIALRIVDTELPDFIQN